MTIEDILRKRMDYCSRQAAQLKKVCTSLPPEKVHCYERSGHIYWRITDEDGNRRYLQKSDLRYAQKAALRQKYEHEIEDLECEIKACRKFLDHVQSHGGNLEKFLEKNGRGLSKLLGENLVPDDAYVSAWLSSDYEKSLSHPENLRISTSQNFIVRSKAEALIAEGLFQLKIPARYEQIHVFGGERIAADFTILNPYTHEEKLIEYFGMMDRPEYRESFLHKMAVYTRAGIVCDRDILCFYETPDSAIDIKYIRMRLENFISGGV